MTETIVTIYNPFLDPLMVTATYCPTCGRPAKTYEEAEEIRGLGECLGCDHVSGEMLDCQKYEYVNEENSMDLIGEEYESEDR